MTINWNGWPASAALRSDRKPVSALSVSKGSIFPTELEIARSFDALIVIFLGGVKTLAGAVVGGATLEYAKDILTRFEYWRLALGLLIIFVVVVAPEGIVGTARKVSERIGLSGNKDAPS